MSKLNVNELRNLDGESNFPPAGVFLPYVSSTPPPGYLLCNGQTIGSGASGATSRANDDTWFLFKKLWEGSTNTELEIQTSAGLVSTRGVDAAADFAANKRLPLPNLEGLSFRFVGSQSINGRTKVGPTKFGEKQEDSFQGHWFAAYEDGRASVSSGSNFTLRRWGSGSQANTSIRGPITDGTNGTPRFGLETQGNGFGAYCIVRY